MKHCYAGAGDPLSPSTNPCSCSSIVVSSVRTAPAPTRYPSRSQSENITFSHITQSTHHFILGESPPPILQLLVHGTSQGKRANTNTNATHHHLNPYPQSPIFINSNQTRRLLQKHARRPRPSLSHQWPNLQGAKAFCSGDGGQIAQAGVHDVAEVGTCAVGGSAMG
jgi:hypothetical protein